MNAAESAPSVELLEQAQFDTELRRVVSGAIPATIHEPSTAAKGNVILIPGWSGPRSGPADLLVYLASNCAKAGWRATRIDLPGRGDAEGEFAACDLDTMIAACMATMQSHDKQLPCVLLGLCSGGNVALGAASLALAGEDSRRGDIDVIALSTLPFQPARTQSFENRRRWKNIKQYAAKAASPNTWFRLLKGEINVDRVKKNVTGSEKPASGERNLKDSVRDIEKELLDWEGKGLFVWGGGDPEAPPARTHFEKLHASGMGAQGGTQFHTIAGANHNYYARSWRRELSTIVLAFLK